MLGGTVGLGENRRAGAGRIVLVLGLWTGVR